MTIGCWSARRRPRARRATRCARTARAHASRALPAGFTLIELIVAIVLLAVGLLAMGGLAVTASRQVRGGATQTVAASVAQSRFDLLASTQCSAIANKPVFVGSATTRKVREKWVITDGNDVVYVADTLRVPGRTKPLVYLSVIPCRD